jgi:hypothetical protein
VLQLADAQHVACRGARSRVNLGSEMRRRTRVRRRTRPF